MTLLSKKLDQNSQIIHQAITKILAGRELSLEPMRYSAISNSKNIRSFLFLEILSSLGIDSQKFIDIAAAIEIFHTYSLIHDDLPAMDDAKMRRGKQTLHLEYDEACAILGGDALLTLAFEIISTNQVIDSEISLSLIRELALCGGYRGMIEGQYLDIKTQNNIVSIDELKKIHNLKTGKLFSFCTKAPCLIAGYYSLLPYMEKLSYNFGMLFQITDDIIDYSSESSLTGKDKSKDADLNKPNFVSLLGLENSRILCKEYQNKAIEIIEGNLSKNQFLIDLINLTAERKS